MVVRSIVMTVMASAIIMNVAQAEDGGTKNAHSFVFETSSGPLNFADFAGKAVLVVNTASQCSFTKQYGPLQTLYEKFKDRGLVVVAVPSNDFGGQEPGSNEEIIDFAKREFEVDFPITAKARVKGSDAAPFYQWAAEQVGRVGVPRWNFHKYLIAPDGEMVSWYSTFTKPDAESLSNAIEAILPNEHLQSDFQADG